MTVVSEDEGSHRTAPQQLRAVKYGSPWKVLCSPFVLGQVVFNALSSWAAHCSSTSFLLC